MATKIFWFVMSVFGMCILKIIQSERILETRTLENFDSHHHLD